MPTLEETKTWVRQLHAGQTDKAGKPYVDHVLRVHLRLISLFPDATQDTEHAALLHDAIEDCDVDADALRQRGYSDETIRIVEAVTKPSGGAQTYAQRMDHLVQSGPIGALQVKIADLSDNSDPLRLSSLPRAQAMSLKKRYENALARLALAISGKDQPDL